jgi:hypothetical protein
LVVASLYITLFSAILFFYFKKKETGLPNFTFNALFLIKVLFGFALTYVYTHQYKDRSTADIFKYYDDAKIMYSALEKSPSDYFSMLSGIGNNTFHFDTCYYEKMNHWYKRNDFGMYNDNHTIIRFNALLMPFTYSSFHAHTVIMCFVSFIGLYFLFSFFCYFQPGKDWLILMAVFLAPSVLFWGSGVLKEGILLFSIGGLLFSFKQLFFRKVVSITSILLLCISFFLLLINKFYWLPILLFPLICLLIVRVLKINKPFWFYINSYMLLIASCFFIYSSTQNKNPIQKIAERQQSFIHLAQGGIYLLNQQNLIRLNPLDSSCLQKTKSDSVVIKSGTSYLKWKLNKFDDTLVVTSSDIDKETYKIIAIQQKAGSILFENSIHPDFISFVKFMPIAFFNSSLMPLPWQVKSFTELMASLENSIVLILVILTFVWFKKVNKFDKGFLWFLIFIVLSVFFMVGFTTPVAGAIVRYKMPAIPFLLMIAVCFYQKKVE